MVSLLSRYQGSGVQTYDPTGRLPQSTAPRPQLRMPAAASSTGSMRQRHLAHIAQNGIPGQRDEDEEDDSNPFGRGLGFLINNPVTQTALKPLEYLDYGRRAVTLAAEEFAEGITGQELKATEDDDRSNWEKLKDPTYGVGQLLGDLTGNKWIDRTIGLVGDIAFDPLSYVTAGVGAVAGKGARASSLTRLAEAQAKALQSGDQALIRALGNADDIGRLGKRGLGVANPTQAKAMGLREGGLRLTSPLGAHQMANPIPGTEHIARGFNDVLGRARTPARNMPGARALRRTRSPIGFEGNDMDLALERIITGKGPGSLEGALGVVALDDAAREIGGGWRGVAAQTLESTVADLRRPVRRGGRGLSIEEVTELARRADAGEVNEWSNMAAEMRLSAKQLFDVDLPEIEGVYGMPHVLNRQFRNGLKDAAKNGDASARDFMTATGLREQDLLEESGFLQRRSMRPNADGTPKELDFGGRPVTIVDGTVEELNEKLKTVFPWFDGQNIYETNPILAWQRYISSVSRDVGIRGGSTRVAATGVFPGVRNKSQAPGRFDPYGVTEDVFDAEGNIVQRIVPSGGQPVEDEFWRAVPDQGATTARNKEIRSTQKGVLDNLNTYSEAERADIARELERLADDVLAPMKQARSEASATTGRLTRTRDQLVDALQDNTYQSRDITARQVELTNEIEALAKVRYGIERTARQRTASRQAKYIKDLDTQRTGLIARRDELDAQFKRARELATETDGTPSSIRAARQQVKARVDDALAEVDGARIMARRKFVAANGDIPTYRQYQGAQRKVAAQPVQERGGIWMDGEYRQRPLTRDERVVRKYERWLKSEADATEVPKQRLAIARRERIEFEQAVKDLDAPPAATPAAPVVPEVPAVLKAKADKAEKLLATPRARQLIADQNKLKDLRLRAGKATGKNKTALNRQVRPLAASIDDRAKLAGQIDNARAAIRVSNEAHAELARKAQPRPPATAATPQPDLQRMLDTQQSIAQRETAADRGYLPRIAQTETELATTKNEQVGAMLDNSQGMDAITLDEGMEAIGRRQVVNDAQERARLARTEAQRQAAEMDEMTGGMVETYKQSLQDIEASRLEHERIAADVRKGGITAFNPQARTNELAAKRPTKAGLGRVAADEVPPAIEQPLYSVVEDLRRLAQANPLGEDGLLTRIEAALTPLERRLSKLTTQADIPARQTDDILKAAKKGELAPVMRSELRRTWRELWTSGDVVISDELDRIYKNLIRIDTEPSKFFRALTTYTNFFKTYATLTPGFHIRNGMSATFMNYAMGVPSETQIKGLRLWRRFTEAQNPRLFLTGKDITQRERDALMAVLSSGAGGRYFEAGVADVTQLSTRMQERLFANRFTKASQRFGQNAIEGPVRTSLALDALSKEGADVRGAMQLIDRIQFDYSRVSEFDEKAKRLIPFWTFMSRNLPMQITTMWTHPRTYARYNSFIRNFKGDEVEGTPEYFENIGAFPFANTQVAGMPLFLQPDFAHTRVQEDVKNIEDLLSGENVMRPLTTMNPIFTAPMEFATGRDFFTGRTYDDTDYREAGVLETPYELIAQLLGQTKTTPGGKTVVTEKFLDAMRSINPLYDRAVRLAPQATTGGNDEDAVSRQIEAIVRTLGVPTRTLSPQQQQSAMRAKYYDRRDEQALTRALLQLDR